MAEQVGASSGQPLGRSAMTIGWGWWLFWVMANLAGWAVLGWVTAGFTTGGWAETLSLSPLVLFLSWVVPGVLQWLVLRRKVSRAGWWVLATTVGYFVGWNGAIVLVGVVGWLGSNYVSGIVGETVGWILLWGSYGAIIGVPQWLVLRRQVARAGWWVLVSTVAWVGGSLAIGIASWALFGTVYGVITGIALAWLLRNRSSAPTPQPPRLETLPAGD